MQKNPRTIIDALYERVRRLFVEHWGRLEHAFPQQFAVEL